MMGKLVPGLLALPETHFDIHVGWPRGGPDAALNHVYLPSAPSYTRKLPIKVFPARKRRRSAGRAWSAPTFRRFHGCTRCSGWSRGACHALNTFVTRTADILRRLLPRRRRQWRSINEGWLDLTAQLKKSVFGEKGNPFCVTYHD